MTDKNMLEMEESIPSLTLTPEIIPSTTEAANASQKSRLLKYRRKPERKSLLIAATSLE